MDLPHTRFSRAVDRFIERLGDFISWIWLLLLGIIVANVVYAVPDEFGFAI